VSVWTSVAIALPALATAAIFVTALVFSGLREQKELEIKRLGAERELVEAKRAAKAEGVEL